ncbi:MAG: ABC transporter ATP-binding protein [Rhodospirillales bacterium]|nr:ABC transporter ATP-binding protein [Rhodospirillales bacterium]
MSAIELQHVTKSWGSTVAVRDVSFLVEEGAFVVLLGPSGCGKSTTLRMVAGLEDTARGRILIGGEDMTHVAPAQRHVSMVFQSYALFPHLDVRQNILFGLNVRKVPTAEKEARLKRVAELVGLAPLLDRKPAQLSGGQRQRVALARAIVAENPICLMDEPLSNLDAKLRHEMRVEIRALQQRLAMTVVYVTHDQAEAMSMADRIILMRDGDIEQEGTPDELYSAPATMFTAGFIGTPPMNLLALADGPQGAVIAGGDGPAVLESGGNGLTLGIRPEHVIVAAEAEGGIPARLTASDYLGADTVVTARIGAQTINARVPGHYAVSPDHEVRLTWAASALHVFDSQTGRRVDGHRARQNSG